jgi:hypothetical protein
MKENRLPSCLNRWGVERIVHFRPGDLVRDGFAHFGFHDRKGRLYVIQHQKHFLGLVDGDDGLTWTMASRKVFDGVPNIKAELQFPIYVDSLNDGRLVVSNFGDGRLFSVDASKMKAEIFVDGPSLGIKHAGNCVVDSDGCVWLNEVDGCRVWRFDPAGNPILTLGDGKPGFQTKEIGFDEVKFNWIYDIRRGPDGNIYVLDSKNFALRMIDVSRLRVKTLAGTGKGGYDGDGGHARQATFGSDPSSPFDGPISLSLDENGNMFVGDRYNHVVRFINRETGTIQTIAGRHKIDSEWDNIPGEVDPFNLYLPKISSMDYHAGRLYVPTDLDSESGDLAVLRKK